MPNSPLPITRIDARRPGAEALLAAVRAKLSPDADVVSEAGRQRTVEAFGEPLSPQQVVQRICDDVDARGISAVLEYTQKLDGVTLDASSLRVSSAELEQAHAAADPDFLACICRIRDNIHRFQAAILHRDVTVEIPAGGQLRQRYVPMRRAGLCIPGGAAAYPSTLLMTAVPAATAGVAERVMVAPPTPFGAYNTDLLATCHELGVREIYRMGGAQAVAALAFGIEGLSPVDIVVGPGNLFVALAKQRVFGKVAIDSLAGPSEVVVIADESARPDWLAAELIAQAEHSPGSSIFITWSERQLEATAAALDDQLPKLERGALARQSLLEFGALVLVEDPTAAAAWANQLAPEHLQITAAEAESLLAAIPSAGAVFLGEQTPVALGDYVAGPSHVLPTGGTARFASGLSANDFLRAGSVMEFSSAAFQQVAHDAMLLAEREGLTAHRESLAIRLQDAGEGST